MNARLLARSSLLLLAVAACGKSGSGSGGSSGGKPVTVALAKLGLHADAPGGSEAGDAIVGDGQMIQGPGLVVNIELASDSRPKTAEDASKEAADYSPKNLATEALADGWVVTYDNEGSMGKNYFAQVRREIGGKSYWCETTASQPEQQKNAVAACKSLRP